MEKNSTPALSSDLLHSTSVIRLLASDSDCCEELLFQKMGCFVKLINADMELSTLETYEGTIVLIVGNPFLMPAYFNAIKNLLRLDKKDEFIQWMKDIYDTHGFGYKENMLLQLDYTCRFTRNNSGIWRLFLPCPNYYVGGPPRPDHETFRAAGESLRKWVETETDKLYHE